MNTHGMSYTPVYAVWRGMKDRCKNPSHVAWSRYGGRGIKVCERWQHSFENFYKDMGPRPTPKHSIDRIDNDGDYEPSNCRWATAQEQQLNSPRPNWVTIDGVTKTHTEWCRNIGLNPNVAHMRISKGWDVIRAVTIPPTRLRSK